MIKYSKICQNIGNPWVRQQRTPLQLLASNFLSGLLPHLLSDRPCKISKLFKMLKHLIYLKYSNIYLIYSKYSNIYHLLKILRIFKFSILFKWPSSPSIIRQAGQAIRTLQNMQHGRGKQIWKGGKLVLGEMNKSGLIELPPRNNRKVGTAQMFAARKCNSPPSSTISWELLWTESWNKQFSLRTAFAFVPIKSLFLLQFLAILDSSSISAKTWLLFLSQLEQCQWVGSIQLHKWPIL